MKRTNILTKFLLPVIASIIIISAGSVLLVNNSKTAKANRMDSMLQSHNGSYETSYDYKSDVVVPTESQYSYNGKAVTPFVSDNYYNQEHYNNPTASSSQYVDEYGNTSTEYNYYAPAPKNTTRYPDVYVNTTEEYTYSQPYQNNSTQHKINNNSLGYLYKKPNNCGYYYKCNSTTYKSPYNTNNSNNNGYSYYSKQPSTSYNYNTTCPKISYCTNNTPKHPVTHQYTTPATQTNYHTAVNLGSIAVLFETYNKSISSSSPILFYPSTNTIVAGTTQIKSTVDLSRLEANILNSKKATYTGSAYSISYSEFVNIYYQTYHISIG